MEPMELNYFESYSDLSVHKLMLQDVPRNKAYRDAILQNKNAFEDKVVLDVGSGTGILSVLCAQAGAKKVYAVEACNISRLAEEIVKENKFEDVITVLRSRIEDIVLPEKVDIIVSEWMGFYLLHEGMLDSLMIARKKFLKPNGLMFPETAALYSAPCSLPSMHEYWEDVEGVSMKHFGAEIRRNYSSRALIEVIPPEALLCDPEVVLWLDLREVESCDINHIDMRHFAVANKEGQYQGVCIWFSCTFPSLETEPVTLSTGPEDPTTHWKQTLVVLPDSIPVEKGSPIAYDLVVARSKENRRRYDIDMTMLDPDILEHPEYCFCHMTKCILVRAMLEKYENDALPDSADK